MTLGGCLDCCALWMRVEKLHDRETPLGTCVLRVPVGDGSDGSLFFCMLLFSSPRVPNRFVY